MTSSTLPQNTSILKRRKVAAFADIIKIVTMFIKTIFKGSKKKFDRVIKVQFISMILQIAKLVLIIGEKMLMSAEFKEFVT